MLLIVLAFDPYLITAPLILIDVKHYFSTSVNINGLLGANQILPSNKLSIFYIPLLLVQSKYNMKVLIQISRICLPGVNMYHNFRSNTFHFPLYVVSLCQSEFAHLNIFV
uniref:Uncharacterized protein n=1 Tax=Triticum urartu TaxID=4572 RepID=A0A8R7QRS3_TRIUA